MRLYLVLTSKFSWIPTMEVDSIKAEWPLWTQQAHYKETWFWSFLSLKANLCSLDCETVNAAFWFHNVAINSFCAALWGFFCDFSSQHIQWDKSISELLVIFGVPNKPQKENSTKIIKGTFSTLSWMLQSCCTYTVVNLPAHPLMGSLGTVTECFSLVKDVPHCKIIIVFVW